MPHIKKLYATPLRKGHSFMSSERGEESFYLCICQTQERLPLLKTLSGMCQRKVYSCRESLSFSASYLSSALVPDTHTHTHKVEAKPFRKYKASAPGDTFPKCWNKPQYSLDEVGEYRTPDRLSSLERSWQNNQITNTMVCHSSVINLICRLLPLHYFSLFQQGRGATNSTWPQTGFVFEISSNKLPVFIMLQRAVGTTPKTKSLQPFKSWRFF